MVGVMHKSALLVSRNRSRIKYEVGHDILERRDKMRMMRITKDTSSPIIRLLMHHGAGLQVGNF
jgi:hypothetical protein